MACCDKDGYIQSMRWLARAATFFRLHRLADWAHLKRREALALRHPWMKERY